MFYEKLVVPEGPIPGHHPDCDGWIMRNGRAVEDGPGLSHAECSDAGCGWRWPESGSMGRDGARDVQRHAGRHGHHRPCVGECNAWDEPVPVDPARLTG